MMFSKTLKKKSTQKEPPTVNPSQPPTSGLDNEAAVLLQQIKRISKSEGTMYQTGRGGLEYLVAKYAWQNNLSKC